MLPAAADSYPETPQKPVQCVIQLKRCTFLLSASSGSCCLQNSLLPWACFVHIIFGRKGWNVLDCLLKCIKCLNSVNARNKYIFYFTKKRIHYIYCLWINILFYIYFFVRPGSSFIEVWAESQKLMKCFYKNLFKKYLHYFVAYGISFNQLFPTSKNIKKNMWWKQKHCSSLLDIIFEQQAGNYFVLT